MANNRCNTQGAKDSVCIQTDKIYDSCKSKECAEDLRVYFSQANQALLDTANGIKLKCAKILYVDTDVERIQFNKCYYNVTLTFYFKVTVEISTSAGCTVCADGLCVHTKNAMLFGSEGCSYVFSSRDEGMSLATRTNMPTAIVETVDPVALEGKLTEMCCDCQNPVSCCKCCFNSAGLPPFIGSEFPAGLVETGVKRVYVTLGLFVFIRLQRNTQLLIPIYDFCIPDKTCTSASCGDDPCSFFEKMDFPIDAFYPPTCCSDDKNSFSCDNGNCGCGNNGSGTASPLPINPSPEHINPFGVK